jgi:hypothetical protein
VTTEQENLQEEFRAKLADAGGAFARFVRRFVARPSLADMALYVWVLFVASSAVSIFIVYRLSAPLPETFMFGVDNAFCDELAGSSDKAGIQCILTETQSAGVQTIRLTLKADGEDAGFLQLALGREILLTVGAGDGVNEYPLLARSPMFPGVGAYETQINATRDIYPQVIYGALKRINEVTDAGWSEADLKSFQSKVVSSISPGLLDPLIAKLAAVEARSPYVGWLLLAMYFFSCASVIGYLSVGFATIYTQGILGPRVQSAVSTRLGIFDFMVENLPGLGLIGTVLGILIAFETSGARRDPDPLIAVLANAQVDGGIRFALYTTLIGLITYLPIKLLICYPFNIFAFARETRVLGVPLARPVRRAR